MNLLIYYLHNSEIGYCEFAAFGMEVSSCSKKYVLDYIYTFCFVVKDHHLQYTEKYV